MDNEDWNDIQNEEPGCGSSFQQLWDQCKVPPDLQDISFWKDLLILAYLLLFSVPREICRVSGELCSEPESGRFVASLASFLITQVFVPSCISGHEILEPTRRKPRNIMYSYSRRSLGFSVGRSSSFPSSGADTLKMKRNFLAKYPSECLG